MKQVITTCINPLSTTHSRWDLSKKLEQCLKGERSHTYPYMLSPKQGSNWYHFYNIFGVTRSGIEPTASPSQGKHSTTEPQL